MTKSFLSDTQTQIRISGFIKRANYLSKWNNICLYVYKYMNIKYNPFLVECSVAVSYGERRSTLEREPAPRTTQIRGQGVLASIRQHRAEFLPACCGRSIAFTRVSHWSPVWSKHCWLLNHLTTSRQTCLVSIEAVQSAVASKEHMFAWSRLFFVDVWRKFVTEFDRVR